MRIQTLVLLVLSALVAGILVSGCGSSDSTASSDGGEGNASFIVKGQKNTIVKFGKEADSDELEEAAEILEDSLKARASGDWAGQCATLAKKITVKVEKRAAAFQGSTGGCAKSVEAEAQPLSASAPARKNTLAGSSVAALRVEGDKGYALYHGSGGKNYAMLMEKEDGKWKVASLATTELPKS